MKSRAWGRGTKLVHVFDETKKVYRVGIPSRRVPAPLMQLYTALGITASSPLARAGRRNLGDDGGLSDGDPAAGLRWRVGRRSAYLYFIK